MNFSLSQVANIDAEESILGAILLDPAAIGMVMDLLHPEAFSLDSHKIIYRCCFLLFSSGKATDLLSVTSWLIDHSLIDKMGGQSKLASLVDRTVSAVGISSYAEMVMDKFTRRRLIEVGHKIAELGYQTYKSIEEITDEAEQLLFEIEHTSERCVAELSSETMVRVFAEMEAGKTNGIDSGFYDLNKLTGGFRKSDLIIVAGRPSMGKSAFSMQVAKDISEKSKIPGLIFSMEMPKESIAKRFLSAESGVDFSLIYNNTIARQEDWDSVSTALGTLMENPYICYDKAKPSLGEIRSTIRSVINKHGAISVICIDYLTLFTEREDNDHIGRATKAFKQIARDFDVPVILVSQLSRETEKSNDKRPQLSHLRSSGNIEQDADMVLLLYREGYYQKDGERPVNKEAEVIIAKNRNGATGMVKLLFDEKFVTFRNLATKFGG